MVIGRWKFRVTGREIVFVRAGELSRGAFAEELGSVEDSLEKLEEVLWATGDFDQSLHQAITEMLQAGGYTRLDVTDRAHNDRVAMLRGLVRAGIIRILRYEEERRSGGGGTTPIEPPKPPPPKPPPPKPEPKPTPPEFICPTEQSRVMATAARDGAALAEECDCENL